MIVPPAPDTRTANQRWADKWLPAVVIALLIVAPFILYNLGYFDSMPKLAYFFPRR